MKGTRQPANITAAEKFSFSGGVIGFLFVKSRRRTNLGTQADIDLHTFNSDSGYVFDPFVPFCCSTCQNFWNSFSFQLKKKGGFSEKDTKSGICICYPQKIDIRLAIRNFISLNGVFCSTVIKIGRFSGHCII